MRFEARHRTRYHYSGSVSLDPHLLRVLPRCDSRQRLLSHRLDIMPAPARRIDFIEAWGNSASRLWFEGETDQLGFDVRLTAETLSYPPAGLAVPIGPPDYPARYGDETLPLQPHMAPPLEGEALSNLTSDLITLHAWAEVYLPHHGWHGYDQTHASRIEDQRLILGRAAEPDAAVPIQGSFHFSGEPPETRLETDIQIVVS